MRRRFPPAAGVVQIDAEDFQARLEFKRVGAASRAFIDHVMNVFTGDRHRIDTRLERVGKFDRGAGELDE